MRAGPRTAGSPTRPRCPPPCPLTASPGGEAEPPGYCRGGGAARLRQRRAEAAEECDDGNASNADACLATCLGPARWSERRPRPQQRLQPRTRARGGRGPAADAADPGRRGARLGRGLRERHDVLYGPRLSALDLRLPPALRPRGLPFPPRGRATFSCSASTRSTFSSDVFYMPQSGRPARRVGAPAAARRSSGWPTRSSGRPTDVPVPAGRLLHALGHVVHAARGRLDFLSIERMLEEEPGSFRPVEGAAERGTSASRSRAGATGRASPTASTSARRGPT